MTAFVFAAVGLVAVTLASLVTYRRRQTRLQKVRVYDSPSKFSYD